jgi:hypothetical protein
MKHYRLYIVFMVLGVTLLAFIESLRPTPVDWSPSYSRQDRIPYGTYVLYDLLADIFAGSEVSTSRETVYATLNGTTHIGSNYIFIGQDYNPGPLDAEKLLDFAGNGNSVFIAAEKIAPALADTLGIDIDSHFGFSRSVGGDSLRIRLVNPAFAGHGYLLTKTSSDSYFSRFDTARTTVLGLNSLSQPNFIRIEHGAGSIYINTVPLAFTNYCLLYNGTSDYAAKALSYLPVQNTIWDEFYKSGREEARTPLRFILSREPLRWAYYLLVVSVGLYVLVEGKRRQRIIPRIAPLQNTTLEFAETVGGLYYQNGDHRNIAEKKIAYLLDHVRSNFNLKTTDMGEELYLRIAEKSGAPPEQVRSLFEYVAEVNAKQTMNEAELIRLNTLIEQFFNSIQR